LGLGNSAGDRGALAAIGFADDFTLDPAALRHRLTQALERRERVLAVVSIFGTTEEGALDDLPAIRAVCEEFEQRGLASWLHVDGCCGGCLGAVIRGGGGGRGWGWGGVGLGWRGVVCGLGVERG